MVNRRAQFHAIASGEPGAGHLTAAWQHLIGHEYGAEAFADAYVDFVKRWDWDWVKINPRAVWYAESWGSRFDPQDYGDYVIPRKVEDVIKTPEDITKVTELDWRDNPVLSESIEAATLIRERLQDRAVIQTLFSPLSILLQLADLPLYAGDTHAHPTVTLDALVFDQPERAHEALGNIARTFAKVAAQLVTPANLGGAGLDGIFYAVTGTAGLFTKEQYEEFGRPYDEIVLTAIHEANRDSKVLLHTCRDHANPDWFDIDAVDILQWDQYADGNPAADADFAAVPVAGAHSEDFGPDGDLARLRQELNDTVALRDGRPFLLAPSCTVPTPAADEALAVLAELRA
ncbi:uroporphyrinogen decarboxylase family protein [Bifidobacterium cuniculi]|uniref:Uroporphyrinogen decarboxylase (URO-D) domain-containing protein n=1 Tax=Bifidobacterium cuniculi TaxID=1688 RepID=A0A087AM02_9BIFI|nr:uroporphyrinogen decarboxylase family protein [Bifidobacterium cuniculi]KFI59802.1 hypothetical protein BCUN_1569 [Bifidobacterium cuniculi]